MNLAEKLKKEVAAHIRDLTPYPPGKPIEETKREYGISEVVKLASNENPLGASPLALEALRRLEPELHLYPDGSHYALKKKLSQILGCKFENLSIGCGSNEFIDLLPRVFVGKGCNLVTHKTAFVIYKLCSQLNGIECREAEVSAKLQVDVNKILAMTDSNTRLIMLANPNNPTGTWLAKEDITFLCEEARKKGIMVVLDYAYWEYVTEKNIPDPLELLKKFENVIVLRTFSKAYGLAGLRVGYCVAQPEVISLLERSRQPFNVTSGGLVAAVAALDDHAHLNASRKRNEEGRKELLNILKNYPVEVIAGEGNFLLIDFKKDSAQLYPEFLKRGAIVRPVSNYGLKTYFRISIGLQSEHQVLEKALKEIFK